jgi:hypothetical protein
VLAKHSHGKEIDAADLVIRFNDAPLDGFARQVGRKEDLRFINEKIAKWALKSCWRLENGHIRCAHSVKPILASDPTVVVVPITEAPDLRSLKKEHPKIDWYQIDSSMFGSFRAVLKEAYQKNQQRLRANPGWGVAEPTSGAIGMLAAMTICDEVRSYGMASSPGMFGAAYHYYDDEGGAHSNDYHKSFEIEKDLWRRLATNPTAEIDKEDVAVIPGFARANCKS